MTLAGATLLFPTLLVLTIRLPSATPHAVSPAAGECDEARFTQVAARFTQVAGTFTATPAGSLGGRREFTGRRIDLDFTNADVHRILRLLSQVGGVNIVTEKGVKARVTIKMRNIPWDEVLDHVTRQARLTYERAGRTIYITK